MCAKRPLFVHRVSDVRAQAAVAKVSELTRGATPKLSRTKMCEIVAELGMYDGIDVDVQGRWQFDLTDLQWCALAAACVAAAESGGDLIEVDGQSIDPDDLPFE